ncbi:hypothetical protein D3C85_1652560 [compost metagenome]
MAGQARAIEIDGSEDAALGMVVDKDTVVRQAQSLEPTAGIVDVTQGDPALMLGDQPALAVVFERQRMVLTVIDADQSPEVVVVVLDLDPVGQGLEQ